MKNFFNTTIILLLFVSFAQAEIVVVGNKSNPLTLSSAQIEDIFMGRNRALSNGSIAIPLDQENLRAEFYKKLVNQSIEQINAYWISIVLTEQLSSPDVFKMPQPPKILPNDMDVLNAVNANKNAIGYIDRKNFNDSVRILLVID
ncbi:hypothetical protein DOJK_02030 [Patescibacteria group bacterium]|nr:hypothetical protein DOJK_02030 [Patescibacteria group bacterium]